MLINIHSHGLKTCGLQLSNFDLPYETAPAGFYSLGLHPWWVDKISWEIFEKKVRDSVDDKNFIAWGELGLDRLRKETWDQQIEVLQQMMKLLTLKPQPLLIHCVRSYDEIIEQVIKKTKLAVIFHDYRGSSQITEKLKNYPHVFFSLNPKLFSHEEKFQRFLKLISLDRIFLETDDTTTTITSVYEQFSQKSKIPLDKLSPQIFKNFKLCFPHALMI